jgi:8-oxo-dGTP pyrophosphatase MutT (NUDIX family)
VSALVFTDEAAPLVLVHQHKRYPVVIQPGGHVDPGEHPWEAVLRELGEEAGIVPEQLQVLSAVEFTPGPGRFPAPVGLDVHEVSQGATHTDLIFAFVIDGPPRAQPQTGESSQLLWLSLPALAAHPSVPDRVAALAAALQPGLASWPRIPAVKVGTAIRQLPR